MGKVYNLKDFIRRFDQTTGNIILIPRNEKIRAIVLVEVRTNYLIRNLGDGPIWNPSPINDLPSKEKRYGEDRELWYYHRNRLI